jgi:hypothetical protein
LLAAVKAGATWLLLLDTLLHPGLLFGHHFRLHLDRSGVTQRLLLFLLCLQLTKLINIFFKKIIMRT